MLRCFAIVAAATLPAMRMPTSCHMLGDLGYLPLPQWQAAWTAAVVTGATDWLCSLLCLFESCTALARCMRRPASLRALRRPSCVVQSITHKRGSARDAASVRA